MAMILRIVSSWHLLTAALMAALLVCAVDCSASIVHSEIPQFDDAQIFGASDEPASPGGGSDSMKMPEAEVSNSGESPSSVLEDFQKAYCPTGSSSSSGTSSSTAPSGAGNTSCLLASALTVVGDDDRVGRLACEIAISLPDETASRLFRPPRIA